MDYLWTYYLESSAAGHRDMKSRHHQAAGAAPITGFWQLKSIALLYHLFQLALIAAAVLGPANAGASAVLSGGAEPADYYYQPRGILSGGSHQGRSGNNLWARNLIPESPTLDRRQLKAESQVDDNSGTPDGSSNKLC